MGIYEAVMYCPRVHSTFDALCLTECCYKMVCPNQRSELQNSVFCTNMEATSGRGRKQSNHPATQRRHSWWGNSGASFKGGLDSKLPTTLQEEPIWNSRSNSVYSMWRDVHPDRDMQHMSSRLKDWLSPQLLDNHGSDRHVPNSLIYKEEEEYNTTRLAGFCYYC